jgi:hypothetical protein
VLHDLYRRVNWFFGYAEIGIFGFSSPYARNVPTFSLRTSVLTHFPLARGFLWPLDACVSMDLWVPAVWLIDMPVLPLRLLLAFLV